MEKITSLQNGLVKQVMALREARVRRETGMTVIDGTREIMRALAAGVFIDRVFYLEGEEDHWLADSSGNRVKAVQVSRKVMDKLAYAPRQENILALAKTPALALNELNLSGNPLVVVLESLEKPGNLGAIMRTCDGVGVEAVLVCDPKTDVYNPNVICSSTGAVFTVPVVCAGQAEIAAFLRAKKIKIYATTPLAWGPYTQADFKGASAIVLGSEHKGLTDFWIKGADMMVAIPMKGQVDSLNVSTSAAIILYEALRQRQ